MKNDKTKKDSKQKKLVQGDGAQTVEVLYQKLGDRWFAFSLVEDDVFVGSISQSEIDHTEGPHKDS